MHAFIDESGDTGVSKKSSKYFVLTAVFCANKSKLEKDIKKYLRKLLKINKNRSHYFHAYKETDKVKSKIIDVSLENECRALVFIIDKKVKNLYKVSLNKILKELVKKGVTDVIISNYDTTKNLVKFIKEENKKLTISFSLGQSNLGLQVADCYSFIIFSKLKNGESELFEKFKDRIETKQNP